MQKGDVNSVIDPKQCGVPFEKYANFYSSGVVRHPLPVCDQWPLITARKYQNLQPNICIYFTARTVSYDTPCRSVISGH